MLTLSMLTLSMLMKCYVHGTVNSMAVLASNLWRCVLAVADVKRKRTVTAVESHEMNHSLRGDSAAF